MKLSLKHLRTLLVVGAGAVAAQAIGACEGDQSPQTSSATHFLEDCGASCSAGLSCLCGVCTRPCQGSSECTSVAANATCILTGDAHPTCGSSAPSRVCDVRCTATADCDGTPGAPVCLSGFCRSIAAAAAGPDAASPGRDGGPRPPRDSGTGGSSGETGAPGTGGGDASGSGGSAGSDAGSGGAVPEGSTPTPDSGAGIEGGSGAPGCEARVLYDPKNCGRCGHDCLGGSCVSGTCAPVILALGQDAPGAIAVDDTHVYWPTNTGINKVSKVGGQVLAPVAALFTGKSSNLTIALSDADVFFAHGDPEALASVPKTGGLPSPIALAPSGQHFGVVADATKVYWSTPLSVFQEPLSGGSPTQIATSSGGQYPYPKVAVDSTNVYWLEVNQKFVEKTPIGGGAAVSLASTDAAYAIAVYGGFVYWTNITSFGSVGAAAVDASSTKTVADSQDFPAGIAVDASGVYWTNSGASGTVLTRSLDGGPITVLATNQGSPGAITTDQSAVYWTNGQTGLIMKTAKP